MGAKVPRRVASKVFQISSEALHQREDRDDAPRCNGGTQEAMPIGYMSTTLITQIYRLNL